MKRQHRQLWLPPLFRSWGAFSPPPLCPARSTWLGRRCRNCHRHSSRRSGCHRSWSARRRRWETTSHNDTAGRKTAPPHFWRTWEKTEGGEEEEEERRREWWVELREREREVSGSCWAQQKLQIWPSLPFAFILRAQLSSKRLLTLRCHTQWVLRRNTLTERLHQRQAQHSRYDSALSAIGYTSVSWPCAFPDLCQWFTVSLVPDLTPLRPVTHYKP